MATKICKACGKSFEAKGTSSYCKGPHYKQCEVCEKLFEYDPRTNVKCCSTKCKSLLRKSSIHNIVKICELCGNAFTATSSSAKYCDRVHTRPCPVCGKPVVVEKGKEYQPAKCCSIQCTNKLRANTCLEKYGVSTASQSDTVRQKLHDIAISDEVISKRKSTSINNWGVDNPAKHPDIKSKISKTVSSKTCKDKMKSTTLSIFGTEFAMQSLEGLRRYSESIQEKYGVPYFCMTDRCKESQGNIISAINRHVGNLLTDVGLSYEFETRIDNLSYDIHIKDTNILFEINPTYTHNSIGNHWNEYGLNKNYHLDKTNLAVQHGYRCIHIWDWDDINKIINLVKPKQTIYARNCDLIQLSVTDANEFENNFHMQGQCRGQEICLGLNYNDKLVQVMTFGTPRYNNKYQWELLRLCTDSSYKIVGGAERLFKKFTDMNNPSSILSYCDLSKFNGEVYSKLGFKLDHTTEPNKIWSKGSEKITNNLLISRGYDQLFHTNYGKGTNNEQLMIENGWLPVYDCGQKVYSYLNIKRN